MPGGEQPEEAAIEAEEAADKLGLQWGVDHFGLRMKDDFDRFCTPALFVQDGAGPFSGFVLADSPPGVDPQSTSVLTRVTGEDDVKAIVARFYSFGVGTCSIWKYSSST